MNYFDLYSSYPDQTITVAWDSQVKDAAQTLGLAEILLARGSELFPRFAACYAELRALPRGARRALQRRIARSSELVALFLETRQSGTGRALQYRLSRSLAGAALLLALGQGVVQAATINVDGKARPGLNAADGLCSLIEAIVNANADAQLFPDCEAGSGADTIVLPAKANVRLREVNDNTYGPTGLPLITSAITIEGNGARIRRQGGAPDFRLIAVSNSGDLTLQSVTLSGGYSPYRGGGYHGFGGGALNHGSLTIEGSTISGNTAEFGGSVFNLGTLTIRNSTIMQNTASSGFFGGGGGVANVFYGVATIQDSTISNNSAPNHHGGGVYNRSGILSIQNSTISGNSAPVGGGVYNSAVGYSTSSVTITNSTISNNSASRGGGAVNCGCSLYPSYAILTLNRSLIAGNHATVAPEVENFSVVTADNFNLFGANGNAGVTGFPPGVTDIVPAPGGRVKNILGPLRNNGGLNKTHALTLGSPALDVVPFTDSSCTGTDQRGVTRPQGTGCDIGAFEREP